MNKYFLITYRDSGKSEIICDEPERYYPHKTENISSMSRRFDTEEELRASDKIPDTPCNCCKSPFSTNYNNGDKLRELNICFGCNFWIENSKDSDAIIINGIKYRDVGKVDNKAQHRFLGHGGRDFIIEMYSGKLFETNNLWCNGSIPPHFRKLMPDNAKFIPISKPSDFLNVGSFKTTINNKYKTK